MRRRGARTAIAIGSFDGVHLGAMRPSSSASSREARAAAWRAAVLTFEPLPREFLAPGKAPARLTSLPERLAEPWRATAWTSRSSQRFDARFAALDAAAFARRLRDRYGARWVIVGEDFRYGAERAGDAASLAPSGRELGFEVETLAAVADGGERISSTRVREALAARRSRHGRAAARTALRHLRARRARRQARTRAGIPHRQRAARPGEAAVQGIFAVKCHGAATRGLEGVASLGINPAVQVGGPATLEAFLFDFSGDLYGRRVSIEFVKKLRDEAPFASLEELAAQIRRDCDAARAFFRAHATR